jgi:hypothetical protein
MSVGDSFDLEAGVFEVEEQGGFKAGDVEVAEHLGEVVLVEGGDDLWIDNHHVLNDQIGDQGADVLTVVTDQEFPLNIAMKPLLGEFDDECAFVEFFVKTRLEGEDHFMSGSDNLFSKFVDFHKIFQPRNARIPPNEELMFLSFLVESVKTMQSAQVPTLCILCIPWLMNLLTTECTEYTE